MDLPGGPPSHIHHTQNEAFYVLEGEYVFVCGEQTIQAGPGSFVNVPQGTLHTLRNIGASPGSTLVILTPPGPLERFFEEVGEPGTDALAPRKGQPDMETLITSARRNQIAFVLPESSSDLA